MQDFVLPGKLRLRGERAQAEVQKESAVLAVTQANLRRDAALAWIDVWAAERQLAALRELESEAALNVSAAQAALAGGKGFASDPFAARWSVTQLTDRMIEARRAIARARAQLGRWIGDAASRALGDAPDFTRFSHPQAELLSGLEGHPHVAVYTPMQQMAQADVGLAEAGKHPDWSLEVTYGARAPELSNMLSVMVRVDLPIFEGRRQDPAIRAKLAAAEQVRAQAEDARRAHLADVNMWIADWQAATERMRRIENEQLPLVRSRSQAALAGYAGGKGDLAPVLESRRAEIETRLAAIDAAAEAARAWAQLNTLLPEDHQ
jgi:outer membrane protein TolC